MCCSSFCPLLIVAPGCTLLPVSGVYFVYRFVSMLRLKNLVEFRRMARRLLLPMVQAVVRISRSAFDSPRKPGPISRACVRELLPAIACPVVRSLNHLAAQAVGCSVVVGARRLNSHTAVRFNDHGVVCDLALSKCFAGQLDNWSAVVSFGRNHCSAPCIRVIQSRTLRRCAGEYIDRSRLCP